MLYSGVPSHISQGYPGGKTDGQYAVFLLETLQKANGGISTCVIFVDVEQGNAGSESSATIAGYFEGFCDAVMPSGNYTPGLYFPTGSSQTTFGCAYHMAFDANSNVQAAFIYSPEPEPGCESPPGPSGSPSGAYCNGTEYGASRIVSWQYAENCPPNICWNGVTDIACVDLDELKPGPWKVLWLT